MKHLKELKLNEEFGKMAEISEQSIVDKIKWKLSEMGYLIRFIENPTVNRYLQYYAKEIMNDFCNQIFDEEKIMELTKNLEREIEGPDHPFFPSGVFPDPTKK
jgi:hypothetical protein